MSDLYNLVYVSVRQPNCTTLAIQNILTTSRRNNFSTNTTGILLYSNNRFLQYLEGEKKQLLLLLDHIKKNPLHRQVTMLYHVPIQERIFPSWQMGYRDLDPEKINFQTPAGKKEHKLFQKLITKDAYKEIEGMHILKIFFERA